MSQDNQDHDLPALPGETSYKPESKKKSAKKESSPRPKKTGPQVTKKPLDVPVMEGWVGYSQRRVDLRLEAPQANALRDLLQGLIQEGATLDNGKFVQRPNEALKWLLENIS